MRPDTLESPQPASFTARPIFILADDLTGACDSAVAFVSSGYTVRLMLDVNSFDAPSTPSGSVIAFTTETRNLPDYRQAAERVAHITTLLCKLPNAILFKKVDSAARGHLVAETVAALNASGVRLALVAPAFQQAGRTVHNGILTIRDAAGQNTTVALRDLFAQVDQARIDILPIGPIVELEQGIARAIATGIQILLCDSQAQTDLDNLALAVSRIERPILWTGSAGLARALATILPSRQAAPINVEPRDGRTLVFIGTDHAVTRLQLSHLDTQLPGHAHLTHIVDWANTSPHEIRTIFAAAPTAALVLTGGETAAYVLQSLHASSILLAGELAPGIPWGILEGGEADGCTVVTKSGGFGSDRVLADATRFCAQRSNRRAYAPA